MTDSEPTWRKEFDEIVDDYRYKQFSYGDNRRDWHDNFIDYMAYIANHPNYSGMPHRKDQKGQIMWNAFSERPEGSRFQYLHDKREKWWRKKATEVGYDTNTESNWKTKTAKKIHPTNESVCQTCGTTVDINYIYLNGHVLPKFNDLLKRNVEYEREDLVSIYDSIDIIERELSRNETGTLEVFIDGLAEEKIYNFFINEFGIDRRVKREIDHIKREIPEIIEREPHTLSPGKTGDPPQRMDGLHSYCFGCRHKEDIGRLPENLAQYNQDRRAFEYWTDGNWALTNDLANEVGRGECQFPECNKFVDLTADHIGPLAIGFRNTTLLTGLCASHNSGMGRRLNTWKMKILLDAKESGKKVTSRHVQKLWDECKNLVENDNQAKELSDRLRDNQHYYLSTLGDIRSRGYEDLLMYFLETEHAEYSYDFEDLDRSTLKFKEYTRSKRNNTYTRSLKSRMVRIAFTSLENYTEPDNRNIKRIDTERVTNARSELFSTLDTIPQNESFRDNIQDAFKKDKNEEIDKELKSVFNKHGYQPPTVPDSFIESFYEYMDTIGLELASLYKKRVN